MPASIVSSGPKLLWHHLPPSNTVDVFRLLDWRAQVTPLIGREDAQKEMLQWVDGEAEVLVRFLVGPGGAGKTRLAFEVADQLRARGWAAGQIFLDSDFAVPLIGNGSFLVVDYPEACRAQLRTLLRDLARIERSPTKIRVILLSRLPVKEWRSLIDAAAAASICDTQELKIGPLSTSAGLQLFRGATQRFATHMKKPVPALLDEAVSSWLADDSETQSLPIFVIAAALHCVMDGQSELDLSGAQVVEALVRRETIRLDNAGREAKWGDHAASRLLGLAAVSDGLDSAAIIRLSSDPDFGLPSDRPVEAVKSLHFWDGHRVPPPTPDIVAAELLFEVLDSEPEKAADWLWASLADSAPANVAGLGRVAYDIGRLRGRHDFVRFTNWLAASVAGKPDRAIRWRSIFDGETPISIAALAVAIGRCLLQAENISPFDRASILTKFSQRLADAGQIAEALKSSQQASAALEELAAQDRARYAPELARSLTAQAGCLRAYHKFVEAAEAAEKAVNIWQELVTANPELYEPDQARSLKIWSDCLSENDRREQATQSIRNAVNIWRRLAGKDPAKYDAELARALNSLSVDLWQGGDQEGSTKAIQECVDIWENLADKLPGRYEPELALAKSNLSRNLAAQGDFVGAFKANRSAIKIYGVFVAANPARYGPQLARTLENSYQDYRKSGDARAAIEALRESVEIKKKLLTSDPYQFSTEDVEKLERLSLELSTVKDDVEASVLLDTIDRAEKTVCILLVRGENPDGAPIFAYVAVRADKLEDFMAAQKKGTFYPENFGVVVETGRGEPSPEVRKKMEVEYGFNHQTMVDIPDVQKASEIRQSLKGPASTN